MEIFLFKKAPYEDYGTEESAYYDGATGEITAESGWTPVGDKIRIQIR